MRTIHMEADRVNDTITMELTDSRDISIPMEWLEAVGFDLLGYAQLTLIDDRVAIHKPAAADAKYERACKLPDGSYIRRIDFLGVRLPPQLLGPLGISAGEKIDLTLEENCVSIRKNTDGSESEPEPPEPIISVCCVCGSLRYTENGLIKVASKYICHGCIELVKAL